MRPQDYENMCGVCLLYGVLSLTGEPQTASPRQTAAQASEMDESMQIWFNESCISESYMPSWSACSNSRLLGIRHRAVQLEQGARKPGKTEANLCPKPRM